MPARLVAVDRTIVTPSREIKVGASYAINRLAIEPDSDPYADYLVFDSFTDSNGTLLTNHVPEKKPAGATWSAEAGTWEIQSNRARQTAVVPEGRALIETGEANVSVQATIYFGSTGYAPGVLLRGTDGDNLLMAMANKASGAAEIYKREGAGWAQIASTAGHTWADGDIIKFTADEDDLLSMYQNDVLLTSVTNAFNNTATKAGLRVGDNVVDQEWDDFSVIAN